MHRAPKAANATENDDQKRRHDCVDADVRANTPEGRHDDAGDGRQRRAQCEHE